MTVMDAVEDLCFWAQTLRGVPVAERLEAVAAGGFASTSTVPPDCPDIESARRVRALFDDSGVRLRAHDPCTGWLPAPDEDGRPAELAAAVGSDQDSFLAIAEVLRPEAITVVEIFGQSFDIQFLAERFAAICDRGRELGLRAQLEFAPFTGIPDLATAWEVVRLAGRDNGGLVFDTYHYIRGNRDDALLATVPGEKIFAVHVNDGPLAAPESLIDETLHHRLLPGEGEWDLPGLLAILLGRSGIGDFGVEAISDGLAVMPPREVGERAGRALRTVLAAAGEQLGAVA